MTPNDKYDIELVNVVGGGDTNANFDLEKLFYQLSFVSPEYEPETHPGLIFELPESGVTVMIFSTGKYHLTGANDIEKLKNSSTELIQLLKDGVVSGIENPSVEIRNLVYSGDFGRELDLSQISLSLGYEDVEYNPSSFPGIFYRLETGIVLIFRTGKFVVTGVKDTESAQSTIDTFISQIQSLLEDKR